MDPLLAGCDWPVRAALSMDVVEAAVWRLLTGRGSAHDAVDVPWLLTLIGEYAAAYAARRGRPAVLEVGRPAFLAPVRLVGAGGADAAGVRVNQARCGMCQEVKDASEFWKDKRRGTGLQYACKDCSRARRRPQDGIMAARRAAVATVAGEGNAA